MDDADYTAIKFVRARNLDTEKSIKMLIDCLTWRIKSEVDELMVKGETGLESDPKGIDPETFTRQISHGFTWMQGFNKYGGPVSYVVAKKLQAGEQSQMIMEGALEFRLFFLFLSRDGCPVRMAQTSSRGSWSPYVSTP